MGNPEYSSSLPSSSQFSTSSVQSKDTINSQISRTTLAPPSPFPHTKSVSPGSLEISNSNNNTRRPSTVSFSFRKNSITPNGLHRYVGYRFSIGKKKEKNFASLKPNLQSFRPIFSSSLDYTVQGLFIQNK